MISPLSYQEFICLELQAVCRFNKIQFLTGFFIMLKYKDASECRYDIVSLGEVMLRLDPGAGRIHTTRSFDVWEGPSSKGRLPL